jgi:HK97 family phage portal protein
MKLSLASRIKVLMTGSVDEHIRAFLAGEALPGSGDVDAETAMKYSAVNACIRVLAETFASAPLMLYKKNKDGRDLVTDDPLYDVLHNRPNDEMDPFSFDCARMANLCAGGNSVCEIQVNSRGEIVGLYPYPHTATKIERDRETLKLKYTIYGSPQNKTLRRSEVLHVPNLSFDGVIGMSPLTYAAQAIRLGLSYEAYGVKFYENAAMPSGVFEKDGVLKDDAFKRLKEGIKENWVGLSKAGTPIIAEDGLKFKPITINPVDAQLLESKYFQIEDIARIYRVPQHLINKLDRSTNNNIEHQSLEFVMYTMLPHYKRDEGCINAQLLSPEKRREGYYFERKIDGLLRGDSKSRAEAYAQGRQWGWLSVNDIRKLENLPPIDNGNIYLQPSNMVEAGSNPDVAASNYARTLDDIYKMIEERR